MHEAVKAETMRLESGVQSRPAVGSNAEHYARRQRKFGSDSDNHVLHLAVAIVQAVAAAMFADCLDNHVQILHGECCSDGCGDCLKNHGSC